MNRLNLDFSLSSDEARAEYARRLVLRVDARQCEAGILRQLASVLVEHRADGRCVVWVEYHGPGARVELAFGPNWRVKPGEALVMPAKKPHSVYAPENFKWMLTVIFPHNN